MTTDNEALADDVATTAARLSTCVAQIYKEISSGRMTARKMGRRTLIERTEQARWLSALPIMGAKASPAA